MIQSSLREMISSMHAIYTRPLRSLKSLEQSSRSPDVSSCSLRLRTSLLCWIELQSFLGLVNYYRKFIPSMPTLVSPLNQLLSKDTPWCWSPECKDSFQALKDTFASSSVLAHYSPKLEVQLAVDASPVGLGAVISYITEDGTERPIAYASRSLTKGERNYSFIEKEALAIIFGIRKFE